MSQFGSSPASNDSVALAIASNADVSGPSSTAVLAETIPAYGATTAWTPSTGDLYIWPVNLGQGQSVGHVGYVTSTTAGGGVTHSWACVADNNYTVQAISTDGTAGTIAASTWTSVAMATPYTATYSGRYFLGVMVAAGTMPTICATSAGPLLAMITGTGHPVPVLGGQSNTGASTPVTVGTQLTTPTATGDVPYLYATA